MLRLLLLLMFIFTGQLLSAADESSTRDIISSSDKTYIESTLRRMMDCRSFTSCYASVQKELKNFGSNNGQISCQVADNSIPSSYIRGKTKNVPGCAFAHNVLKPHTAYPKRYWKDFDSGKVKKTDVCGAKWVSGIHTMTCSNLKGLEAHIRTDKMECLPNKPDKCGKYIEIPNPSGRGKIKGKFVKLITTQKHVMNTKKNNPLFEEKKYIRIVILDDRGKKITYEGEASKVDLQQHHSFNSLLCDPTIFTISSIR